MIAAAKRALRDALEVFFRVLENVPTIIGIVLALIVAFALIDAE